MSSHLSHKKSDKIIDMGNSMIQNKKAVSIGLVVGSVVILGSGFGAFLAGAAVNALTLAGVGLAWTSFLTLYPSIVYGLKVAGQNMNRAITQADPISAMQVHLETYRSLVSSATEKYATTKGLIEVQKKKVLSYKSKLGELEFNEEMKAVQDSEDGLNLLKEAMDKMRDSIKQIEEDIDKAKIRLELSQGKKSISEALGWATDGSSSGDNMKLAMETIDKKLAASSAELTLRMEAFKNAK